MVGCGVLWGGRFSVDYFYSALIFKAHKNKIYCAYTNYYIYKPRKNACLRAKKTSNKIVLQKAYACPVKPAGNQHQNAHQIKHNQTSFLFYVVGNIVFRANLFAH